MNKYLCNFICLFLPKKTKEAFIRKYLYGIDKNFLKNDFYASAFNFFQEKNIQHYYNKPMDNIFQYKNLNYVSSNCKSYIEYLLKDQKINYSSELNNLNPCIHWGYKKTGMSLDTLNKIINQDNKFFLFEDGFIRSITGYDNRQKKDEYSKGISFVIDDLTCYYDFNKPSRIEQMLNDKNLIITEKEKQRAKDLIKLINDNKIMRYNSYPIYKPEIGRKGKKKVLIFDQSYDDEYSIYKTNSNDETYKKMFESALNENPNYDIIIRIDQHNIDKKFSSFLTKVKEKDNIYKVYGNISAPCLIDMCDKIYVCNTSLGLFSLMKNKEVHIFGLPFYANWGLSIDDKICPRRKNKRTIEELVYITFMLYTYYVDPRTKSRCEVEQAIDYIIETRDEYFKKNNIRYEIY